MKFKDLEEGQTFTREGWMPGVMWAKIRPFTEDDKTYRAVTANDDAVVKGTVLYQSDIYGDDEVNPILPGKLAHVAIAFARHEKTKVELCEFIKRGWEPLLVEIARVSDVMGLDLLPDPFDECDQDDIIETFDPWNALRKIEAHHMKIINGIAQSLVDLHAAVDMLMGNGQEPVGLLDHEGD